MSRSGEPQDHLFHDPEALAAGAAEWLCALAERSHERFAVCLSGGSTPRRLYEILASEPLRARFPWARTHWFWGDERFVPADHPDSNARMARLAMLDRAGAPEGNIHAVPTALANPAAAAAAYAGELQRFYGSGTLAAGRPLFDVTLLGLGEDGHTASLFPGSAALEERTAWTAADLHSRPEPRITLTYPVLESSREVAFLVAGAGKREMLKAVRRGDDYPAARVHPSGRLHWFLDRQSAGV